MNGERRRRHRRTKGRERGDHRPVLLLSRQTSPQTWSEGGYGGERGNNCPVSSVFCSRPSPLSRQKQVLVSKVVVCWARSRTQNPLLPPVQVSLLQKIPTIVRGPIAKVPNVLSALPQAPARSPGSRRLVPDVVGDLPGSPVGVARRTRCASRALPRSRE